MGTSKKVTLTSKAKKPQPKKFDNVWDKKEALFKALKNPKTDIRHLCLTIQDLKSFSQDELIKFYGKIDKIVNKIIEKEIGIDEAITVENLKEQEYRIKKALVKTI